jgi:prepilin-type N-terminal cleavage/methylation domain-containing protein
MDSRGFTLLEVVIALGILCVAVLMVAQLLGTSAEGMAVSRAQTMTATLASARLEQLRALTFEFDDGGLRLTDLVTDLSAQNPGPGGRGLSSAGADSLQTSTAGFVDYLDAHGQWVGSGASVPADAVFMRRWSIDPLGGTPDGLVLQVLVRPISQGFTAAVRRARADTRLVTILARTHR